MNYSLLKKCLVSHCKMFSFHNEWIVFDYLLMLTIFHVPSFFKKVSLSGGHKVSLRKFP